MNIPGYQLGRLITEENYCRYYNATCKADSRLVILQLFDPELADHRSFCNQFDRITTFLSGKSFGIMVPLRQAGTSSHGHFAVYDYFAGFEHPLRTPVHRPLQQTLAIGIKLANTLSKLHQTGLVHGAVQISNLLLQEQNQVILAPLALPRVLLALRPGSLTALDARQALYLAPEAGQELTAATDFYALGVSLYQLLCARDPFTGSTQGELKSNKLSAYPVDLPEDFAFLAPLFEKLLSPDPGQRIGNVMQFTQSMKECGIHIKSQQPSERPLDESTLMRAHDHAGKTGSHLTKTYSAPVALLTVLLAMHPPNLLQQPPGLPTKPDPAVLKDAKPESTAGTKPSAEPKAKHLFTAAQRFFDAGALGSALISVNNALKEDPGHIQAKELKEKVVHELEIRPVIERGERQLTAGQLLQPIGDNAFETFLQLARLLPDSDPRAHQGMQRIAEIFHSRARRELADDQLNRASASVASGLSVITDHAELIQLRGEIDRRRKRLALARQQRIDAQRAEQDQLRRARAEQARLRQQQATAEAQQQALLARRKSEEEALRQKMQRELEQRQQLIRQNAHKVNRLLASVESYLASHRPNLHVLGVAREDYLEAKRLADPADQRIAALRGDLTAAYRQYASRQMNSYQYDLAREALEQALTVDDENPALLALRQEIDASMLIRNQQLGSALTKPLQKSD